MDWTEPRNPSKPYGRPQLLPSFTLGLRGSQCGYLVYKEQALVAGPAKAHRTSKALVQASVWSPNACASRVSKGHRMDC